MAEKSFDDRKNGMSLDHVRCLDLHWGTPNKIRLWSDMQIVCRIDQRVRDYSGGDVAQAMLGACQSNLERCTYGELPKSAHELLDYGSKPFPS